MESPRIWVLRGGAIGDFVLTLPVFQALREQWPEAHIAISGYPGIAGLARETGLVDEVHSIDRAECVHLFSHRPVFSTAFIRQVRSFHLIFSFLYDPDGLVRSNLKAAGAKEVFSLDPRVVSGHAADHFAEPLKSLAIYLERAVPRLDWPADRVAEGGRFYPELPPGRRLALHPGSGSPAKNWPVEAYLELARVVQDRTPYRVVFLCGEADQDIRRVLDAQAPEFPVWADRSLLDTASLLSACAGFVGNDSGITHLAAALGIPVVALFGPTDPEVWAPRGRSPVTLLYGGEDMRRIGLEQVWEALRL